jgi:hypothetical protein
METARPDFLAAEMSLGLNTDAVRKPGSTWATAFDAADTFI